MKNKKEQIEEVENVLKNEQIRISNTSNGFKDLMKNGVCSVHSKAIYSAGYRKATEVIDELVKNIMTDAEPFLSNMSRNLIRMCASKMKKELAAEMRQEVDNG